MRRNHVEGRDGGRINAALAATGCNFSLFVRSFEELFRVVLIDPLTALRDIPHGRHSGS
jgi:hypothetical protein